MTLETERLILREFTLDDLDSKMKYSSDPENVWFMVWGPEDNAASAREYLEDKLREQASEPRLNYDMALCLRDTGEHIGGFGISIDRQRVTGELGWILRKDKWHNGYATEAAGALLKFGFETLGLHRIVARCNADNIASARVMERLGMRREAHFRSVRYERVGYENKWIDEYVYAILRDEWSEEGGR